MRTYFSFLILYVVLTFYVSNYTTIHLINQVFLRFIRKKTITHCENVIFAI